MHAINGETFSLIFCTYDVRLYIHISCSFGSIVVAGNPNDVNSVTQTSKRCSTSPNTSLSIAPPHKSPRMEPLSPGKDTADAEEAHPDTEKQQMQIENTEELSSVPDSPSTRRKSWRRATITRRSLPALPNPYQVLCSGISTSLSQQERLEKLMEASMMLAVERTQNVLQSVPNTLLDCFQNQVEHIKKDWGYMTKCMHSEAQVHPFTTAASSCDPTVRRAMEKVQKTINRLQAESESWGALLNKHRDKAAELKRKVEQGQEGGVSLDATCVSQSSQYLVIQSKPDYHGLLSRQQPKLHTIAMIMDTQCKMVRELLSIKEQSQLLVKETSSRLAMEAGFQDLLSDPIRNLMAAPLPSAII
ncbi:hypothetical protein JOB18_044769 [Solea senegalensis]|uniref:DSN1 component of MIS12 kinetochore complex n=2 Tax=Solea senegalensis TaxID=28829 RepID=A0AAV6PQ72_SOLSE|nr:hypothetical protein JOB18_007543 [Solea senegalensis]KAG7495122.1 hypothetical protein JOB18_044769 [Solea senegalensis]